MRIILIVFLLFRVSSIMSQNLVINGDFEIYDSCPPAIGCVNGYLFSAYNPQSEATTDYFNSCDIEVDPCIQFGHVGVPLNSVGTQHAKSGNGYIGLYTYFGQAFNSNYREYIVLKLQSELISNKIYNISFYVSKAESMGLASNSLMVAFSNDSIPISTIGTGVLSYVGFKMSENVLIGNEEWYKLSKNYLAIGGEKFLIIGNFLDDDQTMVVDNSFEPFICTSTSYIGYPNACYYYIDNVTVEEGSVFEMFPNVITPNNDGINDSFICLRMGYQVIECTVINRWGNSVYQTIDANVDWDGKIDNKDCEEGVYFYKAILKNLNTNEIENYQGTVSVFR